MAQAMSRTNPTAPISALKTILMGPPLKRSLNGITRASISLLVSGYCFLSRPKIVLSSACASGTPTPARATPKTASTRRSRRSSSAAGVRGCHSSVFVGNCIPCGITPTTVAGISFTLIVCPRIFGSAPYRSVHTP